jgi:hypothetical protein
MWRAMKRGPWTEDELAFLREHWEKMDDATLAIALNRPMSSVAKRRLSLGLKRPAYVAPTGSGRGRYVRPSS